MMVLPDCKGDKVHPRLIKEDVQNMAGIKNVYLRKNEKFLEASEDIENKAGGRWLEMRRRW